MTNRGSFLGITAGAMLAPMTASAQASSSDSIKRNELGPENSALKQRVGQWNMTETVWNVPGALPITTTGLIAERRMIGSMLQESLRPVADDSTAAIRRIDYLTFNRVEGRWEYVSMDLRAPVGIMTAQSVVRGSINTIELTFQPFAIAGGGHAVAGQMLRMSQVITNESAGRDTKRQYFELADGSGARWLAHRYSYVRRT